MFIDCCRLFSGKKFNKILAYQTILNPSSTLSNKLDSYGLYDPSARIIPNYERAVLMLKSTAFFPFIDYIRAGEGVTMTEAEIKNKPINAGKPNDEPAKKLDPQV